MTDKLEKAWRDLEMEDKKEKEMNPILDVDEANKKIELLVEEANKYIEERVVMLNRDVDDRLKDYSPEYIDYKPGVVKPV